MKAFRSFDIFKKVPKDLTQRTNLGGAISIITALLILYFMYTQIANFWNPPLIPNLNTDSGFTREQMEVNINIELPRFPCEMIALDLQDQMFNHQGNIGGVKKFRIDRNGKFIDNQDFQLLREENENKQFQMIKEAFKNQYGCILKGTFYVNEVPGNFHISSHGNSHFYNILLQEGIIKTIDVSHKINYLFFGPYENVLKIKTSHPGSELTPLNGHERIYQMQTPRSYNSHYHIDIVPTHHSRWYSYTKTYQYVYNHNSFEVDHMPALYFNYHIGGCSVYYQPKRPRLTAFLITFCAVIGGIYTIAHVIFNFIDGLLGNNRNYIEIAQ